MTEILFAKIAQTYPVRAVHRGYRLLQCLGDGDRVNVIGPLDQRERPVVPPVHAVFGDSFPITGPAPVRRIKNGNQTAMPLLPQLVGMVENSVGILKNCIRMNPFNHRWPLFASAALSWVYALLFAWLVASDAKATPAWFIPVLLMGIGGGFLYLVLRAKTPADDR